MKDELVLVASPHHPWSCRESINGNELCLSPYSAGKGEQPKDMEEDICRNGIIIRRANSDAVLTL